MWDVATVSDVSMLVECVFMAFFSSLRACALRALAWTISMVTDRRCESRSIVPTTAPDSKALKAKASRGSFIASECERFAIVVGGRKERGPKVELSAWRTEGGVGAPPSTPPTPHAVGRVNNSPRGSGTALRPFASPPNRARL